MNLKFSQFKEGNTLEVLESKTGKKKEIIVPAKVWEIVERRRQAFPKDEYVFTSHSNRASGKAPVSREQVNREIKQAAENVGIKGTVGCHSFRKFSATQVWEKSKEGANKRGNSSRLTQSFHFFMFEPIFSPVNALNQPI